MAEFDYLIVGAGLYGSIFAHEMHKRGRRCLVIEKRSHLGGNCYTETLEGIQVHKYGAHIFHTSNQKVWDYMNQFAEFNRYTNSPLARWKDQLYNLPFNMNTFHQLWGVTTPREAEAIIVKQRLDLQGREPTNLEEQALSLVGVDIYERLIRGYTEKQWGRSCRELPASIIRRLPLRFTFDNNYFNDTHQGIPIGGYTQIFTKLLDGIEVRLHTDYLPQRESLNALATQIVYTGPIDAYFDYQLGHLEYRSLRFENEVLEIPNYQGNAVINYTERETPYTRIIEHKHFEFGTQPRTVITREYPLAASYSDEPYYPVNNTANQVLLAQYQNLAKALSNVCFAGRLGEYQYLDMHQVVEKALQYFHTEYEKET